MTEKVRVQLDLEAADYRMLTAAANQRGIQVHVLIERLVVTTLHPPVGRRRTLAHHESALRAAHARRLTDREIAVELGVAVTTIGRWRNQLELAKNATQGRKRKAAL